MVLVVPREREETHGVKIGELPSWILTGDNPSKGISGTFQRSLPLLQVCQCDKREHCWDFYSASSSHAFELLPAHKELK